MPTTTTTHLAVRRGGRLGTLVVTGMLALGAAACGDGDSGDEERSGGPEPPSTNAGTTTPSPTTDGGEPPTPDGGEPAPAPSATVLGARDGQVDQLATRLEILELRRSGATVALSFRLTQTGSNDARGVRRTGQIAQQFDDGLSQVTGGEGQDSFTLDGVSLIDATNAKRHLVARDADGACVCDGELASKFVEPEAPVVLSATFGAPPPEVKALDVVIPTFGTFKDVPLS